MGTYCVDQQGLAQPGHTVQARTAGVESLPSKKIECWD